MASRLGNYPAHKKSAGTGSGAPHRRAPFGHLTIGGKAAEVVRVSVDELFSTIHAGTVLIQAVTGNINVSYTLADIDLAMAPNHDGAGHWINLATNPVAPGSIVSLPLATAYRITFVADGVVYMSGV